VTLGVEPGERADHPPRWSFRLRTRRISGRRHREEIRGQLQERERTEKGREYIASRSTARSEKARGQRMKPMEIQI
jgi:hypothetical protein